MPLVVAVIITGVLLIGYFWGYIVEAFQKHIIPWCKDHLGPGIASLVEDMFVWLDKKVTATKRSIKEAWSAFARHIYGSETKVVRTNAVESTMTRTDIIITEDGKAKRRVAEQTVAWHELPENLRTEMLRMGTSNAIMDNKAAIRDMVAAKAAKEGMVLELAT